LVLVHACGVLILVPNAKSPPAPWTFAKQAETFAPGPVQKHLQPVQAKVKPAPHASPHASAAGHGLVLPPAGAHRPHRLQTTGHRQSRLLHGPPCRLSQLARRHQRPHQLHRPVLPPAQLVGTQPTGSITSNHDEHAHTNFF
jgi:hypothetical protein